MNAILSEIEKARQREKIDAWNKNEGLLANRLAEKLLAKFAAREQVPPSITEAQSTPTPLEQEVWQDFKSWCDSEGVRFLPSRPSSVAAWMLDRKLSHERMLDAIAVITKMHDRHSLPNPTATAAVRSVLELEIEAKPPRTWKTEIKEVWGRLPADIRYEIARLERSRDVTFSRLWHEQIELKKQLEKDVKAKFNAEKQDEVIATIEKKEFENG